MQDILGDISGSRADAPSQSTLSRPVGFDPGRGADFTVADVLAWARTKPADEAYNYTRGVWSDTLGGCALCHFLRDTGRAERPTIWPHIDSDSDSDSDGNGLWADNFGAVRHSYPAELEPPLKAGTFGALVTSLEALCPETPVTADNWAAIDAYMQDDLAEQFAELPAVPA